MVSYKNLGLMEYQKALEVQAWFWERRVCGGLDDIVLFCEHPLTYTIGLGGNEGNLLVGLEELEKLEARLYRVNRGGDITCHSPGQLVAYPIIKYREYFSDAHRYLRGLEDVIIRLLSNLGIKAQKVKGLTGAWVGGRKVASIGVRISRGVTTHGFALNVNNDLTYFDRIVPCGFDLPVTSLSQILGRRISLGRVRRNLIESFETVLSENRAMKVG